MRLDWSNPFNETRSCLFVLFTSNEWTNCFVTWGTSFVSFLSWWCHPPNFFLTILGITLSRQNIQTKHTKRSRSIDSSWFLSRSSVFIARLDNQSVFCIKWSVLSLWRQLYCANKKTFVITACLTLKVERKCRRRPRSLKKVYGSRMFVIHSWRHAGGTTVLSCPFCRDVEVSSPKLLSDY